jgi:hypothetical protein
MNMRPTVLASTLLASAVLLGGCVERRIVITSEPSGATIFLNDAEVGRTPVEVDFTYFGVYDVRVRKEGYEPLVTTAEAKAPPHEWPGLDLLALLVPVTKVTRIDWHFTLAPADADESALLDRAGTMRTQFGER